MFNLLSLVLMTLLTFTGPLIESSAVPIPIPTPVPAPALALASVGSVPRHVPNFRTSLAVRDVSPDQSSSSSSSPSSVADSSTSTEEQECTSTTSPCPCGPSTSDSGSAPSTSTSTDVHSSSSSATQTWKEQDSSTTSKVEESTGTKSAPSSASQTTMTSETSSDSSTETGSTSTLYESQAGKQTSTSSAAEPEETNDQTNDGDGDGDEQTRGKFGSLVFRLGQHTMIMNQTTAMDDRAQEPKTVDYTLNNDLPQAYAGEWTFVAFGTNDDGDWGMNVGGSEVKSSVKCSIRLDVGLESDQAIVELTDTAPYYKEVDPSNKLTMNCETDNEASEKAGDSE
ncbi:hypothetical protein IAU59_000613 [Kwoniella sp. CBS 9459]